MQRTNRWLYWIASSGMWKEEMGWLVAKLKQEQAAVSKLKGV